MARIVLASYMVRYPLGGNLSWALQWLIGLKSLGHDVFMVERAGYPDSCYNPVGKTSGEDCSYGTKVVHDLLDSFELGRQWSFIDAAGTFHGMSQSQVREILRTCDLFIDMGADGDWSQIAPESCTTVFVEGEPGFTQMKWAQRAAFGETLPAYDYYYSMGANIGTRACSAPTAGFQWRHVPNIVATDLFYPTPPPEIAPFTTVMNWRSHSAIEFEGRTYGQKDVEFTKFAELPTLVDSPFELAVSGNHVPVDELTGFGWSVRDAQNTTLTVHDYHDYILRSRGEFSVAKNVFVSTQSGWFSDRSAAYLASGRPVVLQDTGFGTHLPCGEGLFAVGTLQEAASAIKEINANFQLHSKAAREIALEHLDSRRVLKDFLDDLGF